MCLWSEKWQLMVGFSQLFPSEWQLSNLKKEDTGFSVRLESLVCAEPNGLWDWWSGNEHTCWNQRAIHCSPTIKAIQFLFWSAAEQKLKIVCGCGAAAHGMGCICGSIHNASIIWVGAWVSLLVSAVHDQLCTPVCCHWQNSDWLLLLGIMGLFPYKGWWGVTANQHRQLQLSRETFYNFLNNNNFFIHLPLGVQPLLSYYWLDFVPKSVLESHFVNKMQESIRIRKSFLVSCLFVLWFCRLHTFMWRAEDLQCLQ